MDRCLTGQSGQWILGKKRYFLQHGMIWKVTPSIQYERDGLISFPSIQNTHVLSHITLFTFTSSLVITDELKYLRLYGLKLVKLWNPAFQITRILRSIKKGFTIEKCAASEKVCSFINSVFGQFTTNYLHQWCTAWLHATEAHVALNVRCTRTLVIFKMQNSIPVFEEYSYRNGATTSAEHCITQP